MKAAVVLVALSACFDPQSPPSPGSGTEFELAQRLPTPLDVLVVLDDTTAMSGHPGIPNPANLAGVLTGIYNDAADLRIAVTTVTTGTLRTSTSVPTGVVEHRVSMLDGSIDKNYSGALADAVGSLTNAGSSSTAANTALASTESALASFESSGAALGVLLVSATDDGSPAPVSDYAAAIQAHADRVMVSTVTSSTRVVDFANLFTHRYNMTLATYNMEAISVFAQLFQPVDNDACFPLAPASTGACLMFAEYDGEEQRIEQCPGEALGAESVCFELRSDSSCASGYHVLFGGAFRMYRPRITGACQT